MSSPELITGQQSVGKSEMGTENTTKMNKKRKSRKRRWFVIPKFGCMRSDAEIPTVEKSGGDGSLEVEAVNGEKGRPPTHLVVMVNGIIGSAQNWRYAAKQFVIAYPQDVIVHCSESNYSTLTFDGVDVMGKRLADEVISVVQHHPNLLKISFISHSLGGLIARYAIAVLYKQDSKSVCNTSAECQHDGLKDLSVEEKYIPNIAGLEPMNFITVATPHLGAGGHKQVPVFCGSYTLEKVASRMSWLLGRTGKHLFLTDSRDENPPLLLQMVDDSEDLPFISALQSFRRRVAYANARFDHLVGWSTSSLRRRNELPKRRNLVKDEKYPHIVNIEATETASTEGEMKKEGNANGSDKKDVDVVELMLRSLTKMSWERVDVYFRGSKQRYLAHNTIQVKTYCINSDGADVIQHMIDNFLL